MYVFTHTDTELFETSVFVRKRWETESSRRNLSKIDTEYSLFKIW